MLNVCSYQVSPIFRSAGCCPLALLTSVRGLAVVAASWLVQRLWLICLFLGSRFLGSGFYGLPRAAAGPKDDRTIAIRHALSRIPLRSYMDSNVGFAHAGALPRDENDHGFATGSHISLLYLPNGCTLTDD